MRKTLYTKFIIAYLIFGFFGFLLVATIVSTLIRTQQMDDFGSGYSSLNSLKDLPLNVLKLDAEFFNGGRYDCEDAERGYIVVGEAIRLAKSLNMRTVAEGIEERDQVEILADMGCDMIQGFYFAKPMPFGDYENRMKKTEDVQ